MRRWRNWQTRRLQVPVVVKIVWVQVPFSAFLFYVPSEVAQTAFSLQSAWKEKLILVRK